MNMSPIELVRDVRQEQFGDRRSTLIEVSVDEQRDSVRLYGTVLDRPVAEAFVAALRRRAPEVAWQDELTPLVAGAQHGWAMLRRAVADVWAEPRSHAERVSQVVWGEAVEVLRLNENDWAFVRLPDGYLGWMHCEALLPCTGAEAAAWLGGATHVVTDPWAPCYRSPLPDPAQQIATLGWGAKVQLQGTQGALSSVLCPSGEQWWIPSSALLAWEERPPATVEGLTTVVGSVQRLMGVPYLWGGRTSFGIDCSGLCQAMYKMVGIPLRRDADQQCRMGTAVSRDEIRLGDLLFFGTCGDPHADPTARQQVTHVAFALGRDSFLHSSSRAGGVCYGSLDDHPAGDSSTYRMNCLAARRFVA